jgi:hypothetical protein
MLILLLDDFDFLLVVDFIFDTGTQTTQIS